MLWEGLGTHKIKDSEIVSLISHLTGFHQEPEYSEYVQKVRDAKQKELNENSRFNKMKRHFQKDNLEDEVEEIANFEEPPELESSESTPSISTTIKKGMSRTKTDVLNKGEKIKEYWDSINDAPVVTPAAYIAVESEAIFDEETRDKMDTVLNKSKKIAPMTKKAEKLLSEKQSRKAHLKSLRDSAYEKARAERKARDQAEAESRAIERGRYYGSTTVAERTVDRAKTLGKGAKKAVKTVQSLANELGNKRFGYKTKQGVKQAKGKINGGLTYKAPTTKARTFTPARRREGPVRRKETLAIRKASPVSTSSQKGSPMPSKVKGSPSSLYRKGGPSSFKGVFFPASFKGKSMTNKPKFTGFGKHNKERPSFL